MPGQNLQVQFLILISADPCGPVPSHVKTELTVTVPAHRAAEGYLSCSLISV